MANQKVLSAKKKTKGKGEFGPGRGDQAIRWSWEGVAVLLRSQDRLMEKAPSEQRCVG